MTATLFSDVLPVRYSRRSARELDERIAGAKSELGSRLIILGHHYQRDEVIKFADFRGDSLKLAKDAAARPQAEFIVFCGVHFMAESADILSQPRQTVILPDLSAGCSMADMADIDDVEECWDEINRVCQARVVPVTYVNSAAALKAFCGKNDGVACTSSNCEKVLRWALGRGEKVLFFPDQHLGRNTAWKMGIPLEEMVVWDPSLPSGGLTPGQIAAATIILWNGYCSVHQRFTVDQIKKARARFPQCRVIVHPECAFNVVQAADDSGSTEYISRTIKQADPGSVWAVGTEIHMVNRLAKELPDRTVFCLDDCVCMCATMYRIDPEHLLFALENLVQGNVVNQVKVDEETAKWALIALNRMLEIS